MFGVEIGVGLIVSALIAGVLMFLAPCTLPLVPVYLAFISGVKQHDVAQSRTVRRHVLINAIAFVIGFSLIFISFGVLAGFLGSSLGHYRGILSQIGGAIIIGFGLMMLHVVHVGVLKKEIKFKPPSFFTPGRPLSAACIGATFALGWTPCVGPVLATILLLASTTTTAFAGALLLFIFSLGLAVPFLLTALMYTQASSCIKRYAWISKGIDIVGGVFLILIGLLILTDSFSLIIEYGYVIFGAIGIDGLFDYF